MAIGNLPRAPKGTEEAQIRFYNANAVLAVKPVAGGEYYSPFGGAVKE